MHAKVSNVVDYGIYLAVDETTESPRKKLYSPLCRVPDPHFSITEGFSFH